MAVACLRGGEALAAVPGCSAPAAQRAAGRLGHCLHLNRATSPARALKLQYMQITADEDCKIFIYWQERTWDFCLFSTIYGSCVLFLSPSKMPWGRAWGCMHGRGGVHPRRSRCSYSIGKLPHPKTKGTRLTPGETQPWHGGSSEGLLWCPVLLQSPFSRHGHVVQRG